MNPNTRIESIKAYTPPSSGDLFVHPTHGIVRLVRRDGGDCWWARTEDSKTVSVRPSKLRRHIDPDSLRR